MNKNAIQKYAIWARNELRNQITQNAFKYGITPKEKPERRLESVNGIMLSPIERKQRDQLVDQVLLKGFDQVVEELAYTWFNRLIAIRFMEVNDYLPEHIRVLSSSSNEFKPEILTQALNLDEKHFKKDLILRLIDEGKQEELYRYLLLAECNALNEILPVMFEQMDGYTELMLPANLLKSDSVIGKLISDIDEADWKVTGPGDEEGGQVQIIGWLYQYYNSELKDETFADLKKKNKKISKERIPAATQLFTPDWIVRYMVENSLGRLWLEGHPNDELKKNWKYYLDEAEQEDEVESQLKEIREEYATLKPEDLSVADLAMGSGHILVYAFDVLMQIYRSEGYRDRDAVKSILENNLYGLDIDDRAAQLAYFAIMMKAREYDRRIFSRGVQPNVFAIQESNGISDDAVEYFANGDKDLRADVKKLISEMKDAKEYGSIITTSKLDYDRIQSRLNELENDFNLFAKEAKDKIQSLVGPARLLNSSVWVCCMNPPYLGNMGMNESLQFKVKSEFPDSKTDLFAAFIDRGIKLLKQKGFLSMITQHAWMFLSSFEELRTRILENNIVTMAHLGPRAFDEIGGEVVQTTSFILRKANIKTKGIYSRLVEFKAEQEKKNGFLSKNNEYLFDQSDFDKVPSRVISYWNSHSILENFSKGIPLGNIAYPKQGLATADNNRFLRYWFEIEDQPINGLFKGPKWFPYNKGGEYRKWYGNREYLVNWENDGYEIKHFVDSKGKLRSCPRNTDFYFCEMVSHSDITGGLYSLRYYGKGFIFDSTGPSMFNDEKVISTTYLLGVMNSVVLSKYFDILCPTLHFTQSAIAKAPILKGNNDQIQLIDKLVKDNIELVKSDWDESETSWDFITSPIVKQIKSQTISGGVLLHPIVDRLISSKSKAIKQLEENEEKLNSIFIKIYGVEDSLSPEVDADSLSIKPITDIGLIKDLISYSVGTLFGRYSYDWPGLTCTTHKLTDMYSTIVPDPDNIIPISEDEYFEDDLTVSFIDWVKAIFGEETLEENLQFIADSLGGKGSSREIIRKYFLNDFFADHCKMYKKRPIYWLFDSGKKNGFKCLIYMHRYQPDTLARIRTDYVHEQQERYRSQIKHINDTIDDAPKSEQVKMRKQLKDLAGKLDEVTKYEEKIHHLADQMIKIDLDDGVKHNYAIFQNVLAKIK